MTLLLHWILINGAFGMTHRDQEVARPRSWLAEAADSEASGENYFAVGCVGLLMCFWVCCTCIYKGGQRGQHRVSQQSCSVDRHARVGGRRLARRYKARFSGRRHGETAAPLAVMAQYIQYILCVVIMFASGDGTVHRNGNGDVAASIRDHEHAPGAQQLLDPYHLVDQSWVAPSSCAVQLDRLREVAFGVGCGSRMRRRREDGHPRATTPCRSSQMYLRRDAVLRGGCGWRNRFCWSAVAPLDRVEYSTQGERNANFVYNFVYNLQRASTTQRTSSVQMSLGVDPTPRGGWCSWNRYLWLGGAVWCSPQQAKDPATKHKVNDCRDYTHFVQGGGETFVGSGLTTMLSNPVRKNRRLARVVNAVEGDYLRGKGVSESLAGPALPAHVTFSADVLASSEYHYDGSTCLIYDPQRANPSSCTVQLDRLREVSSRVGCGVRMRRRREEGPPSAAPLTSNVQMDPGFDANVLGGCRWRNRRYRLGGTVRCGSVVHAETLTSSSWEDSSLITSSTVRVDGATSLGTNTS